MFGKTTVLRCLAGLERAEQGLLQVDGKVWQDESKGIFLKPYQRPIGMVFQEARLFPHINVEQSLLYGVKRKRGLKGRPEEFEHILDLLGIEPLLERKPERLSGGELQRVAIGRALLTKPELLLMDEPLAALDNRRKREIMPYLERLHEELEIPIIYVSHSSEEMIHLADRLVHLEKGRTMGTGEVVEMLSRITDETDMVYSDNQFDVSVAKNQTNQHVITVESPLGQLHLPVSGVNHGEQLRLRIAPSDILLSTEPLKGVALLNTLAGNISEINMLDEARVRISVQIEGHKLDIVMNQKCYIQTPFEVGQSAYASFNKTFIERCFTNHNSQK